MSTSSIFGIRPTESRSSATAAVSPKPKETTGGAAITTEGTLDAELEYTPQRRSTAATLADIVNIYPVMVAIVPGLHRYDLLSLSLVSKEIHEILGQSTSNKYWKHLWSKCRRLKCEARPKASCSDAQHCVACRKGMCQANNSILVLIHGSAPNRLRYVCRVCILSGRNALLSESPTLFGKHTMNQITAGRLWKGHRSDGFVEIKKAQVKDITFSPNRLDLFHIAHQPHTHHYSRISEHQPTTAIQTIKTPEKYDPQIDRVREHETSRCVCLQAGLSIPLCNKCMHFGYYHDLKYQDFARHDTSACECGNMLVDFPGEKEGEIIPGAIWDPKVDSLPASTNEKGEGPAHEETIEGLCGWCGFRVYRQKESGKLPETVAEWEALWRPRTNDDQEQDRPVEQEQTET